jgi:hypothetical protein
VAVPGKLSFSLLLLLLLLLFCLAMDSLRHHFVNYYLKDLVWDWYTPLKNGGDD